MTDTLLVLAADPISQVVNQRWSGSEGTWLWSAHIGNLVLAALITVGVLWIAAKNIATGPEGMGTTRFLPRGKIAGLVEVLVTFVRDEVARPLLGKRAESFLPFLLTLFFFILVNNLLGLIPISKTLWLLFPEWKKSHVLPVGMTATQNLYVTAGLAVIAFLVINIAGIRAMGIGGYLKHLTAETPWPLWPLMIPIEVASTFIKPIALAIRLFANMTAGHILMVVLYTFAASGVALVIERGGSMIPIGGLVSVASFIGAVGIFFLELLVAFIQAFIFTFLTAVFISQLEHHDEHEHHGEHGHEHAHA